MFFTKKHLPQESPGPTFSTSPWSSEGVRIHGGQGGSTETAAHTAFYHFQAMAGHCACFCVSVAMSNQSLKEIGEETVGAMEKKFNVNLFSII